MPEKPIKTLALGPKLTALADFVETVRMLRSPEGCPWDREQTHRSLVPYLIEESFELAEAIENGDDSKIREELGDVLLQVVLHTQIASETGRFDVGDVARGINEKMIRRHPHVFGEKNLDNRQITSNEVLKNWQRIKAEELASTGLNEDSLIEAASKKNPVGKVTGAGFRFDIPISLPALQRASKIGEKTKTNRFDWPDWRGVFNKIEEEYLELKQALEVANSVQHIPKEQSETGPSHDPIAIEIGDLLFTVAQLARHRGIDPEQALRDTNARFERRYGVLKNLAVELEQKDGRGWDARSQEELERLWQAAKSQLREAGLE